MSVTFSGFLWVLLLYPISKTDHHKTNDILVKVALNFFIGNLYIYKQINHDTENYLSVWHQTHYDITDNNNVSLECLNIHYHWNNSLTCQSHCDITDNNNVSLECLNIHYHWNNSLICQSHCDITDNNNVSLECLNIHYHWNNSLICQPLWYYW